MKRILFFASLLVLLSSVLPAASKTFDMYVIDTEGGKSLLLVSPSGESMLIDTGFPGSEDRDAKRIAEAVKAAGLTQVDHLVTSHYDGDHVGNVTATAARVTIKNFYDHGDAAVKDPGTTKNVQAYLAVTAKGKRTVVKPGDKIPFKGIDVLVVTAAGKHITTPVKGGGAPNPYCKDTQPMKWDRINEDNSENGNAVGLLFTYGKFRMLGLRRPHLEPGNGVDVPEQLDRVRGPIHGQPPWQRYLQLARAGGRPALAGGHDGQRRQEDRSAFRAEAPELGAGEAGGLPVALFGSRRGEQPPRGIHRQHRAGLERSRGRQMAQGVGG